MATALGLASRNNNHTPPRTPRAEAPRPTHKSLDTTSSHADSRRGNVLVLCPNIFSSGKKKILARKAAKSSAAMTFALVAGEERIQLHRAALQWDKGVG